MSFQFKKILVSLLMILFVCSISAQEEEEEIACENIPEALSAYNQDVQLERYSFKSTLKELSFFLKNFSDENQLDKSELLAMIEQLENMRVLIDENEMILSTRGYNIEYFLDDCLNTSSR